MRTSWMSILTLVNKFSEWDGESLPEVDCQKAPLTEKRLRKDWTLSVERNQQKNSQNRLNEMTKRNDEESLRVSSEKQEIDDPIYENRTLSKLIRQLVSESEPIWLNISNFWWVGNLVEPEVESEVNQKLNQKLDQKLTLCGNKSRTTTQGRRIN